MGKSPQERGVTRHVTDDDPTIELDTLEQTVSIDAVRVLRFDEQGLRPDPIPQAWILEGSPVARSKLLAGSTDEMASTHMWDCTAGRFNWIYDVDEVIHVLQGSAVVEDAAGARLRLQAGDTFLFPAGSRYHWTVSNYIRELAFLHSPLSRRMRLLRRVIGMLAAPFKRQSRAASE